MVVAIAAIRTELAIWWGKYQSGSSSKCSSVRQGSKPVTGSWGGELIGLESDFWISRSLCVALEALMSWCLLRSWCFVFFSGAGFVNL